MSVRVGLIFGGASVEHEVSVVSARGVAAGLAQGGLPYVPIAVTRQGEWLAPGLSEPILRGSATEVAPPAGPTARVRLDPGVGAFVHREGQALAEPLELDVVFCLIHGWGGEDGRIQGALELAGLPYVGAGVRGSALGMDKELSKLVFERRGLPVGPWRALREAEYRHDGEGARRRALEGLRLPLFVKPANGGSSVGVRKVGEARELEGAIAAAFELDDKVVLEQALDAREIECAVLGNAEPEASVPGEIVPSGDYYDYEAKYESGASELLIPAPLDDATAAQARRLAVQAFLALDLAGLARVDFFLDRASGGLLLNEVNTLPGFTPISMFPKLWEASGLAYPVLLRRLVELAIERARAAGRRSRRR